MKSYSISLLRAVSKLRWQVLGLLCLAANIGQTAPGITIGGTPANININDEQSTNVFASATVTPGSTNWLTLYVSFTPTNLGTLSPLPTGVVQTSTNFLIGPTNAAGAANILNQFDFTPAANYIPVPNSSNVLFHIYAIDANTNSSSTNINTTVHVAATNDAPVLTASGLSNITDKQTINPFVNVMVTDVDDQGLQPQTVTVTLSNTNGFLVVGSSGFASNNLAYTYTGTPASVSNAMSGLQYKPLNNVFSVDRYFTNVFTIVDTDGYASVTNRGVSVVVYSTNDAPVLSASGLPSITDKQSTNPFVNVEVTDPDERGTQLQTITVTLAHTNTGFLLVTNSGFTNENFTYTYTGAASTISNAISKLIYQPINNLLPVGEYDTNVFTIVDSDGYVSLTNTGVIVVFYSTNDAPTMTGAPTNHILAVTGQALSPSPFSTLTLADVDHSDDTNNDNGQVLSWKVTLTGASPLGQLAYNGSPIGTSFAGSNQPPFATDSLRNLTYLPPSQGLPLHQTNTLQIAITADDQHSGFVSNNILLDLYSIILPPGLSGTQSGQTVYDNSTIAPFSKVTIKGLNGNAVTVQIQLGGGATNDIQGQFINLGSFSKNSSVSPAIYSFSGTSEAATTAIDSLLFQPTANRINGSSTDTATFNLTLIDGAITNAPDPSTTVIIVPVNDAPQVFGVSPLININDNQTATPFNTILITDADEGGLQTNTVTISLDDPAKGAFSASSLTNSRFNTNGTSYTFDGTPSAISTAIKKLVFVPQPNRVAFGLTEITTFTILLNDSHGGIVANNSTVVRTTAVGGIPVVNLPNPQPVSLPAATNVFPFQAVSIMDASQLKVGIQIISTNQGYFTTNSLTHTNGSVFTSMGGGNYLITGYATNITPALQQLTFVPNTNLAFGSIINFSINVTNASRPSANVSKTHSVVLRTTRTSFIVTRLGDYDPAGTPVGGTLRSAIANAKSGDHITFDIRSGVAGVPDYPAVIRLMAPLVLNNDVVFDGPGAERLTISGDTVGNGTATVQLFAVNAKVTMNRLTFANGYATYGGAFEVGPNGNLKLSYCAVTDCRADVWGGGVDVFDGVLNVDHCLFRGNSTGSQLGQGGGAVSIFSDQTCTFLDTTFASNQQGAASDFGGGALYASSDYFDFRFDPYLSVYVLNCTFAGNVDASNHGSAIRPDTGNTQVMVQNSIFADGQGKSFEMDQTGYVISLGGNISDDSTYHIISAGGGSYDHYVFLPPLDQINVPATNLFSVLANNGGPTPTYALLPASSALNTAVSNVPVAPFNASTLGADQRGYFRTDAPDIGAFERNASQRIIIEEIGCNPVNANNQFIEFYIPRDSAALDIGGLKLLVDGVLRHTFSSTNLQPGQALVLLSPGNSVGVASGVPTQTTTTNLALSSEGGVITVQNSANQVVFEADYVSSFFSTDPNDYGYLSEANQSLVLSPQFQGVFLPFQRVVAKDGGTDTNLLSHPGYDSKGNSLSGGNAPPSAFSDESATDAHTIIPALSVLANDVDMDITDTIKVEWVGINTTNYFASYFPRTNNIVGYSKLGAKLTIDTNGTSISYDPTWSTNTLLALPQGVITNDTFFYTIQDYKGTNNNYHGSNPTDQTSATYSNNLAKATAQVTITVIGVNSAPLPQDDYGTTNNNYLSTPENALLDFTTANTILTNDIDLNSDDNSSTLNIIAINATNGFVPYQSSITTALGASVTLDVRFNRNQTHITYDPRGSDTLRALNQTQSVNDTFYYSVQDSHGAVGTAAISILVTGVDNSPVANADSLATDENTALTNATAYFLGNDTDLDNGHTLHISSVSPFSAYGASVQIVGTNVIYNPVVSSNLNALAQKEFATDTFTYTTSDEWGMISNATATVLVTGINDTPVSQADYYTTNENSLLIVPAAQGVLANDRDADTHDLLRVIPFTVNTDTNCYTSTNGGAPVTMSADGSFTFDPRVAFDWLKQGEIYYDTFKYVVMDHSLSIASDDNFAVNSGTSNNVLPVLANDAVMSGVGGAFTIIGVSIPNHGGGVFINASNNGIIYTPAVDYVGTESFTYTNSDGLGGSDWATVTVTLNGNVLYAINDAFRVAKGTTNMLNLLANDLILPVSGASISITALGTPSQGGSVSFNGTGPNNAVNYTPNSSVSAPFTETFTYTITSGTLTASGIVTVAVVDRTNSPVVNNDKFTVIADSANNPLDVLANDADLSGTNATLTITGFTTNNLQGTVAINLAHNRLVYTPSSGVSNLSESVTYYVSDGAGGMASASVLIQVTPGGFYANDDYFTVIKNSSSNSLPVMVNDIILPNLGQHLAITDIGLGSNAPQHGTVNINSSGTGLIYTPTANFNGVDTFTYEIFDQSPARAQGRVTVSVLDNSTTPSNPDFYRVARESVNNLLPVLVNDYTLPVTPGSLKITGLLSNGVQATVSINGSSANNSLLYTPDSGFIGRDYFSYVFIDNLGNQGTNLVAVTVGDLAPRDDAFNVVSGTTNNYLNVRANDYPFPDTNSLRTVYSLGTPDQFGNVTATGGGAAVLYTPAPGFVGIEHFSYQLKDDTTNLFNANVTVTVRRAGSDRDTNTVTMAVVGVNDIPTITGAQSGFHITDKQTVQPFTNVVIGDIDECGFQTNTVTVSLDAAVKGVLTNLGGFANISPGVYQMKDTPPTITTSLKTLVFVPTENRIIVPTSEMTAFTIVTDDGYVVSPVTNNTTTVLVDSVNDAPTIVGAITNGINDKQTVKPFPTIVIADVDNTTTQALIAHITLDHVDNQTLTNLGGFTNLGGGVYAYGSTNGSVTAAMITTALQGIVLVPTPNHIIVPSTVTTRLALTVDDTFAPTVTNNQTTVSITASNDVPTIVGTGTYSITDVQTVNPFATTTVADVDDDALQLLTVHIALDHLDNQSLTNLGGFTLVTNGYFVMSDTPTNITTALRGIVFVPTPNHIPVPISATTRLILTVDDAFAPTVTDNSTTVTITSTNDAPTIAGNGNYYISDKQSVQPFATIIVADVDNDGMQPITVDIVMDNLDKGALQNLGGFTQVTNGLFEIYGTPTNITKALRDIIYVPVPNHIPVPTAVTTHLTLLAADGFVSNWVTNLTTVSVTASNDAPVISGTVAGQIVYDRSFIKPFVATLITEVDNDATQALRVTVTLDSATKGALSSLGGFNDLGGGVYSYGVSNGTVTAAMATTALRGLVFTPSTSSRVTPGSPETTRFTIRVDDFFAPTVVDSNTTVVAIDPLTAKVMASDKTSGAKFGYAVATTRDLAIVGAPNDSLNTNSGSVYLFARSQDGSNTWIQIKKILPPDGRASDAFGTAVGISGDTIVVGSPFNTSSITNAGAVYVFKRNLGGANQWGFEKKLVSTNSLANDQFGSAVAISGDDVVVGAPLVDLGTQGDAGAAYVFERNLGGSNQWGFMKRLVSTNPFVADHFGSSVAISGDDVVVGAPLADLGTQSDAGAAYIFERNLGGANQWGMMKRLVSTNPFTSDQFGSAVAINGDSVIVGMPLADANGTDSGATYLFARNQGSSNTWGQVDKFLPAAVGTLDYFGSSVAICSNTVVVGANNGKDSGIRYGTAFMFRIFYDNPPQLSLSIQNQMVQVGVPFAFAMPVGAFLDPDIADAISYSLAASPSVPTWLNFDSLTGDFSGTATAAGYFPINLVATDIYGLSTTNQFLITAIALNQSNFNLLSVATQAIGPIKILGLKFSGIPGYNYRLQLATNLLNPSWTDISTQTADGSGQILINLTNQPSPSFYRMVYP